MWTLPLCMLMHRPLPQIRYSIPNLCPLLYRVANLKEVSEKLKKCISNLKKFYKYFKNLQIFFLNIAMLSKIIFSLCKNILILK